MKINIFRKQNTTFSDWTLVCWIISDVLEKLTVRLMNNENDWEFKNFVFWVWTCLFLHLKLNLLRVNTTDSQFPRLPAELRITVWTVAPPLSGPAANHRRRSLVQPITLWGAPTQVFSVNDSWVGGAKMTTGETWLLSFRFIFWMFYTNLWICK